MNTGLPFMDLHQDASSYRQNLGRSLSIGASGRPRSSTGTTTSSNHNAQESAAAAAPVRRTNVYSRSISCRNGYNTSSNNGDWTVYAIDSTTDPTINSFAQISRNATNSLGYVTVDASSCQSLTGESLFLKPECLLFGSAGLRNFASGNDDAVYSQFTKCHTCYDLIPTSAKLIVFDMELTVRKAFFAMVEHGVRAAPIWDNSKKRFVGMLTITDFIHMLRKYYKSGVVGIRELEEHKIATWRGVLSKDDMLKSFRTLEAKETLYEAVKTFCHERVHRLPIMDPVTGNILYILTSKKIFRFLYIYIRDLPSPAFLQKTPKELGIGSWKEILTLREDTKLIDALSYFLDKRVSALPVINDRGEVVAMYAKANVFYLAADKSYNNLDINVKEALNHRSDSLDGLTVCNEADSLAIVLKMFFEEKAHRVVVVDNELRVVGIISLSDVLSFLVLLPKVPDRSKTMV